MLEIGDRLADFAGGGAQNAQRCGMRIEEVGVPAQIGDNVAASDLARQFARSGAVALPVRLVARQVGHGYALAPAGGGGGRREHPMSVAMQGSPANSAAAAGSEEGTALAGCAVPVLLPLPLPAPLDYRVADGAGTPEPGSFVRVALGSRQVIGVVWDRAAEESGEEPGSGIPLARLKAILDFLPTPPLQPELRRFVERAAA